MTETQLLKYCLFYRGEVLVPVEYDGKAEGKIWAAEKIICEQMPNDVDESNPALSMAELVSAYVGKWSPYKYADVMSVYLDKCPAEVKSQFH